jgi:autotransporter family porin
VPEVRADNATPNSTRGVGANSLYPRVTGNFTGTTDEILQWAACKWGIDEDVVRAQIAKESWWHMSTVGDNGESFGLGQVRVPYHGTAFANNNAKVSSAYNVDYTYAVWRECYEGRLGWLNDVEHTGTYAAGDANGCLGVWFAGRWRTADANTYIAAVQSYLSERVWESANFKNG